MNEGEPFVLLLSNEWETVNGTLGAVGSGGRAHRIRPWSEGSGAHGSGTGGAPSGSGGECVRQTELKAVRNWCGIG
jgi:hypothetical protein